MKTYHGKIYRLVKAKDFFGAHGHETSKLSPEGISNYPSSHVSLVESRLHYCNTVWGNYGTSLKDQSQRLHDRAATIVIKCDDTNSLLHKLGWLNVLQLIDFDTAVMVR